MNEQLIADNIFFNCHSSIAENSNVIYYCQSDKKSKRIYNKIKEKLEKENFKIRTFRKTDGYKCNLIEITETNSKIHFISGKEIPSYVNPSLCIFDRIPIDVYNIILPCISSNAHVIFI